MSLDVKSQLRKFLAEDIGSGDITSSLLAKKSIRARIISREEATVSGTRFAKMLFGISGCSARILRKDGDIIKPGESMLSVYGDAKSILASERTALNLLARMGGIATMTSKMVKKIDGSGVKIYATRKTAPGMRYFDKMAVEDGGGHRHRMRLDEMVMIKDNHIAAEGSLESIITKAKARRKKFEVEVEDTTDAVLAASLGASIIMLDNFTPARIKSTVSTLKDRGLRNKVLLEASGGITLGNITRYAGTGVDIISVGAITSSAGGINLSLEV